MICSTFQLNRPLNLIQLNQLIMNFTKTDLQKEITYKTSRSGGKGGQNVNKVSSKDGYLQVVCEEERSQYLNKEKALEKLHRILTRALHQPKARKATKPSKVMIAARLANKKIQAAKKENRKRSFDD